MENLNLQQCVNSGCEDGAQVQSEENASHPYFEIRNAIKFFKVLILISHRRWQRGMGKK